MAGTLKSVSGKSKIKLSNKTKLRRSGLRVYRPPGRALTLFGFILYTECPYRATNGRRKNGFFCRVIDAQTSGWRIGKHFTH